VPSPGNKEVKTPSPNPGQESLEMLQAAQTGDRTPRIFQEAILFSELIAAQQISIKWKRKRRGD
jgi:hypothetical protein